MSSECKNFTAPSWWTAVQELVKELNKLMAQLRRDRGAFSGRPMLFYGEAPGLTCVGWSHGGPARHEIGGEVQERSGLTRDERAWLVVDFRKGDVINRDHGRAIWAKEISVEVRLPEPHAKEAGEIMRWDSRIGRKRRLKLRPKLALDCLRLDERRRLRDHVPGGPIAPPRVWIDPQRTPLQVTLFSLFLILWQEKMVELDPGKSPDA